MFDRVGHNGASIDEYESHWGVLSAVIYGEVLGQCSSLTAAASLYNAHSRYERFASQSANAAFQSAVLSVERKRQKEVYNSNLQISGV